MNFYNQKLIFRFPPPNDSLFEMRCIYCGYKHTLFHEKDIMFASCPVCRRGQLPKKEPKPLTTVGFWFLVFVISVVAVLAYTFLIIGFMRKSVWFILSYFALGIAEIFLVSANIHRMKAYCHRHRNTGEE